MRKLNLCFIVVFLCIVIAASNIAHAAELDLTIGKESVTTGETDTTSGTANPGAWVTMRVFDSEGNIMFFDASRSDDSGNYNFTFKVPDSAGSYTVVAGDGTTTATQDIRVIWPSGGDSGSSSPISYDEGKVPSRIYGSDRYRTAVSISMKGWDKSDTVVLVSGEDYPDALAGVTLAYIKGAPILLTGRDSLNEDTLNEIQRLGAKKIYILGGSGVVSKEVEDYLKKSYNVERIWGSDRYKTAAAIGTILKSQVNIDTAVLVSDSNFPDAAAIGPFAAKRAMPVLFTGKERLHETTEQSLKSLGIKNVMIVGGNGVISKGIEDYIKNSMEIDVKRISGDDRYLTSLEIAKYYGNYYTYSGVTIATGDDFPDALSGAPFAARGLYPVLLTGKYSLRQEILDYIESLKAKDTYILGGPGAISDSVREKIK